MAGCGLPVRRDGGQAALPEAEKPHPPQGQAPLSGIFQMPCRANGRVRVEHVFGAQANDMGGTIVRAKAKIGMKNPAYNMRRLCQLRRINPCPA